MNVLVESSDEDLFTGCSADKYDLYQRSVQTARSDARFLARRFRSLTGRPLRLLREDFCGTAQLLCEFVRLHRQNCGIGIDLDPAALQWCRENNLAALTKDQRRRVTLLKKDVRRVRSPMVDLIVAFNFSYCVFKTRKELLAYLCSAGGTLGKGGVLMLDAHGGTEVPVVGKEKWKVGPFCYVWEVSRFDPVTHDICCKMHFEFRDGTRISNAFVYDWRLWTLPELRELFEEAGFWNVHVLWECTDHRTNLGNGVLRRVKKAQSEGAWYAVVVGQS